MKRILKITFSPEAVRHYDPVTGVLELYIEPFKYNPIYLQAFNDRMKEIQTKALKINHRVGSITLTGKL